VDFHGETRSNDTHISNTDPDAMLARKGKGKEAKLSYAGHVLMENRNGLVVDAMVTQATGTAERDAALLMAEAIPGDHRVTLGADKNYDTKGFVAEWTHDAPCWLSDQSTKAKADRRDFRLDEDGGWDEEVTAPRIGVGGLDVHLGCGFLQSGAHPQPGDGSWIGKCPGRSVSGRAPRPSHTRN
jgi:hypothetical protein